LVVYVPGIIINIILNAKLGLFGSKKQLIELNFVNERQASRSNFYIV
jgi:hypothetical protein